jgi:hypothetical protein
MITENSKAVGISPRATVHIILIVKIDRQESVINHLGHIELLHGQADIADIVANARPATWETRGYKGEVFLLRVKI